MIVLPSAQRVETSARDGGRRPVARLAPWVLGLLVLAAGCAADARRAGTDGGDAQVGLGADGGTVLGARSDARVDAGSPQEDAGAPIADAGPASTDAGGSDAGPGTDAGPTGPVRGNPVRLSDRYCALDDLGQVWCWNRFTTPDEVRLIAGSPTDADPIVELSGECVRGASGALSCFDFVAGAMSAVDIVDPATSTASVVVALFPSPTLGFGCADSGTDLWCWHAGRMDTKWDGLPDFAVTTDLAVPPSSTANLLNTRFGVRSSWLYRAGARTNVNDLGGRIALTPSGWVCHQNPTAGYWVCREPGGSAFVQLLSPATTVDGELGCYNAGSVVRCGHFSPAGFADVDVTAHTPGAVVDLNVMPGDRTVCVLTGSISCHSVWGAVSPGPTPAW